MPRMTTDAVAPTASDVVPLTLFPVAMVVTEPERTLTETAVKRAGTASTKVAPTTGLGPALEIVSVKLTCSPTATLGIALIFVRAKSATGVTTSVSAAEQTPATVQETFGLVLVNPAGGVTDAMFRTEVWAIAQGDDSRNMATSNHGAPANPAGQV